MRRFSVETLQPLTLAEQLDAMLMGWLERHAAGGERGRPGVEAAAVVTVAERALPEIETFCAKWGMTVTSAGGGDGSWAVLQVRGPVLPVQGFTEITRMYRR
jgi:hypothetical protein